MAGGAVSPPSLWMLLEQGWALEPPELRERAEKVLTRDELLVVKAKSAGYGRRRGHRILGITENQWRYRLERAREKLERVEKEAA
jgi:hypothetical protein